MAKKEIDKDNIHYDKDINRIIITLESGEEIEIMPVNLRNQLPLLSEEEKVKELFMMIHELEKERLLQGYFYIEEIKRLNKGLSDARDELTAGLKMAEIKRIQVKIKSFVDEKNNLAEIRRYTMLLEKEKLPLRTRIAQLGHNPDDYI